MAIDDDIKIEKSSGKNTSPTFILGTIKYGKISDNFVDTINRLPQHYSGKSRMVDAVLNLSKD